MKYDPQKHHRRSTRLKEYDYTQPGAYFVTIVTFWRACLFGEIVDDEMRLSNFGVIADECWRLIPEHYPNSDDEHRRIHLYIESNPANWTADDENPEKPPSNR